MITQTFYQTKPYDQFTVRDWYDWFKGAYGPDIKDIIAKRELVANAIFLVSDYRVSNINAKEIANKLDKFNH